MPSTACRVCASSRLAYLYEVRGSVLDRCEDCGFVQVRDQPTEEELHAIYSTAHFGRGKYEDQAAQIRENERRVGMLAQAGVKPGARVLDVGCATGDFIALAGQHYDMWGLELSSTAAAVAREKNPRFASQIATGFIEDQDFAPASFDAIVMWDVIEHVWDPRAVCRQLVGYLKVGGSLFLSTPDIGAATARVMRSRWAFMTPPEHLGFFSPRSLRSLLEGELGLETTSSYASGKWANVGFLAYKLRRVFPSIPAGLVTRVQQSVLGRAVVYVPTRDVRYLAARRPLST
jgi:2-polyprenyl-3-methyl-5-hydroxy-6-metoxy-1,4-benzoquinol methylase